MRLLLICSLVAVVLQVHPTAGQANNAACEYNCASYIGAQNGCFGQQCGCSADVVKKIAIYGGQHCTPIDVPTWYDYFSSVCMDYDTHIGLSQAEFAAAVRSGQSKHRQQVQKVRAFADT